MTSEELWAQMVSAEHSYYAARMELHRSGEYVEQLRRVLKGNRSVETALRALQDARPETLEALIDELFPQAVNYLEKTPAGVDILTRLDPDWLKPRLPILVDEFLAQPNTDYFQYRLLAIVLDKLRQPEALQILIDRAAKSDDREVVDEVEDFRAYPTARID
ncbi:MAG TPA: hypothetical protein VHX87_09580 [Galbitalea sp.]|jgi:hypothetical protein|nr:hypothetical protein [Galbitalea sp.]